ncbi:MAG: DUF4403 family protein [Flavisolibacter sp.]|nr:DUF4403 family protein [Flavisolibacter sp.]
MEEVKQDFLNLSIQVSASPEVNLLKGDGENKHLLPLADAAPINRFTIELDTALQYDSLSSMANEFLTNKRIDISEGFIKKHIIIQRCRLSGNADEHLVVEVEFGGSFSGKIILNGKPYYNSETQKIEVHHLNYDLKTNSLLLKAAKWLFHNRIIAEIKKLTSFDLSAYYERAAQGINNFINKEWANGIQGAGSVNDLQLKSVHAVQEHLLIRSKCTGQLTITISETVVKI